MSAPNVSEQRPGPLGRAWDRLLVGTSYLMALLTGAITLAVVYEVVARYFFNSPTIWAVDFTRYSLVYLTFIGAAWVLRERAHIRVDMVAIRFSARQQLLLEAVGSVVAAAVMAVLVWKGAELLWDAVVRQQAVLETWRVPRWITLLPIPVGSLLMLIEFLRQAWEGGQAWRAGAPALAHRPVELVEEVGEERRGI